jgi:hypothetical protein
MPATALTAVLLFGASSAAITSIFHLARDAHRKQDGEIEKNWEHEAYTVEDWGEICRLEREGRAARGFEESLRTRPTRGE